MFNPYNHERCSSALIRAYDQQIRPNVYAVGHLERCLWDSDLGLGRPASVEAYDDTAYRLLANVSKRLLGKSAYRKRPQERRRLPNMVTLESFGDRPHLNILIHKPERFSFEQLENALREEWGVLPWTNKLTGSLWIQPRTGDCVRYALKEGYESLLPRSLSFHS